MLASERRRLILERVAELQSIEAQALADEEEVSFRLIGRRDRGLRQCAVCVELRQFGDERQSHRAQAELAERQHGVAGDEGERRHALIGGRPSGDLPHDGERPGRPPPPRRPG